MLRTIIWIALRQIRRNFLRSTLTALGIIIGVAAVIAMVTLGQSATAKVTEDVKKLGHNMLVVQPGTSRRGGLSVNAAPLTEADARAIQHQIPSIERMAPTSGRPMLVVSGNQNKNTTVYGSTNEWFQIRGWKIERGRDFSETELVGSTPACVLGQTVKKTLFGAQDAIASTIRVGQVACTVVGILDTKGQSTFGDDQDDLVVMPLRSYQRRIAGELRIDSILVSVREGRSTRGAANQIESLLRERRRIRNGQPDDFNVRDMAEIAKTLGSVTGALTALLGAIAAVSLVVGGIGIMNIMLVSVTERTREIGLRLAIGALEREVLTQFLVEAAALSTLGGVLGIVLGLGGSFIAMTLLGFPRIFSPGVVLLAFVFSGLVGVFFGFVPARRASRLQPIEALRHE